jgi:hypothetical protein
MLQYTMFFDLTQFWFVSVAMETAMSKSIFNNRDML